MTTRNRPASVYPIQVTLTADGFSNELFDRLIVTDLSPRVLPAVCEVAAGLFTLAGVAHRLSLTHSPLENR